MRLRALLLCFFTVIAVFADKQIAVDDGMLRPDREKLKGVIDQIDENLITPPLQIKPKGKNEIIKIKETIDRTLENYMIGGEGRDAVSFKGGAMVFVGDIVTLHHIDDKLKGDESFAQLQFELKEVSEDKAIFQYDGQNVVGYFTKEFQPDKTRNFSGVMLHDNIGIVQGSLTGIRKLYFPQSELYCFAEVIENAGDVTFIKLRSEQGFHVKINNPNKPLSDEFVYWNIVDGQLIEDENGWIQASREGELLSFKGSINNYMPSIGILIRNGKLTMEDAIKGTDRLESVIFYTY
jgi:hypothetical protein